MSNPKCKKCHKVVKTNETTTEVYVAADTRDDFFHTECALSYDSIADLLASLSDHRITS